jgi:hypothetical protein
MENTTDPSTRWKRNKVISDDKDGEQDTFAIPKSPTKKSRQQPTTLSSSSLCSLSDATN